MCLYIFILFIIVTCKYKFTITEIEINKIITERQRSLLTIAEFELTDYTFESSLTSSKTLPMNVLKCKQVQTLMYNDGVCKRLLQVQFCGEN